MSVAEPASTTDASRRRDACATSEERFKDERAREDVFVAYIYSDWNAPNITCLFHLLKKRGTHYADDQKVRLRGNEHYLTFIFCCAKLGQQMLALRLYVCALTSLFLFLVISYRGLGILEAVVIICAILYLILDVRTDLQMLRSELRFLKELEKQVSLLLR